MKKEIRLLKKKSLTLSKLKKKLWDAVSLYIRTRDNFTCFTCGKSKETHPDTVFQAGHLFSRIKTAVCYDEFNLHCQCYSCNTKHQSDPDIYREKFIQTFGQKKYLELYNKRNAVCKRSRNDIVLMIIYFEQELTELRGGFTDPYSGGIK